MEAQKTPIKIRSNENLDSLPSTIGAPAPSAIDLTLTFGANLNLSSSLPTFASMSNAQATVQPLQLEQKPKSQLITVPTNVLANYANSKLLEPVRTVDANKTGAQQSAPKPDEINNNNKNFKLTMNNNVKDLFSFDSASLDPFNDMELKTINEFEELKNILNNHQNNAATNAPDFTLDNVSEDLSAKNSGVIPQPVISKGESVPSVQQNGSITSTSTAFCKLDNFGLPNVSFIDLDMKRNKL